MRKWGNCVCGTPRRLPGRGSLWGRMSSLTTRAVLVLMISVAALVFGGAPDQAKAAGLAPALWFERNTITVKPEYDRENILVVNEGTLVNRGTEPYSGKILFYAPKGADIQMACEIAANGDHNCQFYQVEDRGDYNIVSWQLARPLQPGGRLPVYFEYYYGTSPAGKRREVNFSITQQFPADAVEIDVTPPLRSSAFDSPAQATRTSQLSGGFTSYQYELGPKTAGQDVSITFAYEKNDPRPSVAAKPGSQGSGQGTVSAGGAGSATIQERSGLANPTVAAMVVVVIALFGVALFLVVTRTSTPAQSPARAGARAGSGTKQQPGVKESSRRTAAEEKARARELLLEGKISEKTYQQLIRDIEKS